MDGVIERTVRLVAPAAVAMFAVVAAALGDRSPAVTAVGLLLVVAPAVGQAALLLRGWALLASSFVGLAGFTVLAGGSPANVGWFGVCLLAGWCSFLAARAPALVFWLVATVDFVVLAVVVTSDSGWAAWIAGTLFTVVACLLAAHQRVLLEQLQEAQSGLAEQARLEERTRVAREMHDVIGHALTVTLLHLGTARLAVDEEPEVARASLEEAERHARRSLEEIRSSVGLLRAGDDDAARTTPLPGAAQLTDLVDSFRRTGAPVTCDVVGDTTRLPATTGLAAYRIVQEALTNAARHAPGAPTHVRLSVDRRSATLVVDSEGAPGRHGAQGSGLAGMRERAEAVGGRLTAGPSGRGWRVEAVLPA